MKFVPARGLANGAHAVGAITNQRIHVKLVVPHQRALQKSRVPIRVAFQKKHADLLVDDIQIGDGAVVGRIRFVFQGQDAHFIFVLTSFRFGDLEFHGQFLQLLGVDAFRLRDLALAKQLHGQVFQLASDQAERGVDARLLLDITIRLEAGDPHRHVPHASLLAEGDRVNGGSALARQQTRFDRIGQLKIMAVGQ